MSFLVFFFIDNSSPNNGHLYELASGEWQVKAALLSIIQVHTRGGNYTRKRKFWIHCCSHVASYKV